MRGHDSIEDSKRLTSENVSNSLISDIISNRDIKRMILDKLEHFTQEELDAIFPHNGNIDR